MPPRPSHLQTLLRALRHLLLVLGGVLGARAAALRARRDALPPGHRRRTGLEKALRRIAWAQEALSDPGLLDDAGFRGKLAEVARVQADAGRRALARRSIFPTPLTRLRGARPVAQGRPEEGRCTGGIAVVVCAAGGSRAAARACVHSAGACRPLRPDAVCASTVIRE